MGGAVRRLRRQFYRFSISLGGLLVGELRLGRLGGFDHHRKGLGRIAERKGLEQVVRERVHVLAPLRRRQMIDHPRHQAVGLGALPRRKVEVKGLAEQRVREPTSPWNYVIDQSHSGGLGQFVEHSRRRLAGRRCQGVDLEVAPDQQPG